MTAFRATAVLMVPLGLGGAALAGCDSGDGSGGSDSVQVEASDSACKVSTDSVSAGHITLEVRNTGSKVTEVYIYAPGDRIVTERENIGPGTRAEITSEIEPGTYEIACKPGMKGDGIRQKPSVTGEGPSASGNPRPDAAVAGYRAYGQQPADATASMAEQFAAAVRSGHVAKAKALFAEDHASKEAACSRTT
ncbi:cupredoxin domain-containing protein [Streptomyces sp. NBC_00829]|uniref:cupredoxin domain-containing protein n=1 Tax=Streptomyces sp. NBC_00829 TaxID=2903679 RepID=UPI0038698075|nr:cupredoxin domain-containing protein [Streptomyces sp. NBC_00829]